jgi:hypothetical protein
MAVFLLRHKEYIINGKGSTLVMSEKDAIYKLSQ